MQFEKMFILILTTTTMLGTSLAQEFPIAVGGDNTFGGGAAFNGNNFLFTVLGDASNRYSITAQLVSTTGSLVGDRISLGQTGSGPMVAFDGTNFLVAWTDSFPSFGSGDTNGIGNIYGKFLDSDGNMVGSTMTLATDVNIKWAGGRGGITFQDTAYFLTYHKGWDHHTDYLYGQRLDRTGNPLGVAVRISEAYARESAVAFDGTHYLAAWCRIEHPDTDKSIYGQFVGTSGTLVGTNFLIDDSDNASDNPVSMLFDGSKYWVAFHDQADDTIGRWNLFFRFVSPSGEVGERIMICDSSKNPSFASAGFDGTNYLISWMEFAGPVRVRGRYYSLSGEPIDTAFTLFDAIGDKFPLGGVAGYVNGSFVASATRTNEDFTDGDVYGLFIPGTAVSVQNVNPAIPGRIELLPNYPNPFNPRTIIRFTLHESGFISIKVFDMLGREVGTVVEGYQEAGTGSTEFNAAGLPSGVYVYRLQAGPFAESRRMMIVK